MIFIDDYRDFCYTKIQAPITLGKCPSDHENCEHFIDVGIDSFHQENCYIGNQAIKEINVKKIKTLSNGNDNTIAASRWNMDMIILGVKTEDDTNQLISDFCELLSLHCSQYYLFQNNGLAGFSFASMDVKRSYAMSDQCFGDTDCNYRCGLIEMKTRSTISHNVFELPTRKIPQSPLAQKLNHAFLQALGCADAISRYILLYYMFEIMYDTGDYQALKKTYEAANNNTGKKKSGTKDRSKILYQYLGQQFGLAEYRFFGEQIILTPETLEEIILTRNDLTHRGDMSNLSGMLYHHLLPILQQVIILCNNPPDDTK